MLQVEKKHTRSSGLHLRDILLSQPKLFIDSKHKLSNRQRGHSICVMRHTSDFLCTLSGGERLPPSLGTTITSMYYRKAFVQRYATSMKECRKELTGSPVHHISCALFQPTESAIIQERLKALDHIPSGPKNRSSGLPYRSTKGSLICGVIPGMRRSIIAYSFISKTAGKVEEMNAYIDVFLKALSGTRS